jgi:hypothetical protein
MMTGVSLSGLSHLSFTKSPAASSSSTATSGHTVIPIPRLRHWRRLLMLENSRVLVVICCCSSDRSKDRR